MIDPLLTDTSHSERAINYMIEAERDEQNDALTDLLVQHIMSMEDTDDNDKKHERVRI